MSCPAVARNFPLWLNAAAQIGPSWQRSSWKSMRPARVSEDSFPLSDTRMPASASLTTLAAAPIPPEPLSPAAPGVTGFDASPSPSATAAEVAVAVASPVLVLGEEDAMAALAALAAVAAAPAAFAAFPNFFRIMLPNCLAFSFRVLGFPGAGSEDLGEAEPDLGGGNMPSMPLPPPPPPLPWVDRRRSISMRSFREGRKA